MYKIIATVLFFTISTFGFAQDNPQQSTGNGGHYQGTGSLNVGIGVGFNHGAGGINADYEFLQMGQDFTMAAAVSYYGWDTGYSKHNTIGLGVRFRWYADRVLGITSNKWDVFASGDVGFGITNSSYYGETHGGNNVSPNLLGIGDWY
ncbi:hypothetical protein [Flammeovirga aprica]|uniref:Outer membrane protein beta-barrel domain-containing protein n=1 Tax=Flammeovirga aprica JL-4 TaxID=694437 RepID=A0A7X9RWC4_9BACT|nr:hypothetical protein [Flammeovirga aprica]NME69890.1 hypothetical protein [Flammeovirga aprica JL-4]